jgi:glyoxylase I family protein
MAALEQESREALASSRLSDAVKCGADDGTRTRDRLFTKQLLYQLSYVGTNRYIVAYHNMDRQCGMALFSQTDCFAAKARVLLYWLQRNSYRDGRACVASESKGVSMRLEHVALNVPDPDAMANWYVAHLYMQIIRHAPVPNRAYFLADSARSSVIEIYQNPAAEVPDYSSIAPLVLHFAFNVDDIEREVARLSAAGAVPATPIDTNPAGDRLTFLRDPWQLTIQLVQRQVALF